MSNEQQVCQNFKFISINSNLSNDFGTYVNINFDTEYICPSDGIVRIGGYSTGLAQLNVNGVTVASIYGGNQVSISIAQSWRVRKNDKVIIFSTGNSETSINYINIHHFYPYNNSI